MIWFIVALILFVLEMFSGTFYLLVISASLLSAGLAEWLLQTSILMR
jgi:membrane protein implicated in regulation of membrane protease activity